MFSAWLRSCLSCLWSQVDLEREAYGQSMQKNGVEREMQVCHSQPHLVPPMKLVFYDNLPSPSPSPRPVSSLPPWMHETKSLASRASRRASILVRRKTPKRPRISAPTDFRRTDVPHGRVASFRPLELSIYLAGNRLSDLPEFDAFSLNHSRQPSSPEKALISPFDSSGQLRRQSGPFQFARKPIGSPPSRRGSMATLELQLQQTRARQSSDLAFVNPLIPHFSVLSPVGDPIHRFAELRPISEPPQRVPGSSTKDNSLLPPTPAEIDASQNTLLTFSSSSTPVQHSLDYHQTISGTTGKRMPGQSQTSSFSSTSTITSSPKKYHHTSTKSSSTFQHHSRDRTISNSTVSSKTPSLSSAITAATTIMPSDKDLESAFGSLPVIPASTKNSMVVQEPYIHEEEQMQPGGYEYDTRFPGGTVGLAF
ncbi:hypothetical protein BGW36DRAFT_392871 [Talaromyces proteolyticus]|uniref:Uncharacterized protein n=1 Tax=Talaromyces proteolyticus TaxID=1131652 RepID=A0AAD4L090_9EURO|nr:uncharacterized protein BGW36DRAFT_392871 [Talaromyces proteolyticus]KAH8705183.1 hypothetical protein BGW36DRAFT_392871 [Talaromyces proteolyticus]